jgi:hypothetical protein
MAPVPWKLCRGEQRWEGIPPARDGEFPGLLQRLARAGAGIADRRSLRRTSFACKRIDAVLPIERCRR